MVQEVMRLLTETGVVSLSATVAILEPGHIRIRRKV